MYFTVSTYVGHGYFSALFSCCSSQSEPHSDYLIILHGLTVKLNKKGFGLLN